MKKVTVVKSSEVEVKPFLLEKFRITNEKKAKLKKEILHEVSKKELKHLAQELGIAYDKKTLTIAKKLLNAHIKKNV